MDGRYVILAVLAAGNFAVLIFAMFFGIYVQDFRNLQTMALVLGIVDSSIIAAIQTLDNLQLRKEIARLKFIIAGGS